MKKQASENSELMTAEEVCAALGISQPTLSRRVASGDLVPLPKPPGLKRHHRLTFQRSDIEAILHDQTSAGKSSSE